MEYLLRIEWKDPIASAVARILTTLPPDVQPATGQVPSGVSRGFVVLTAADREVLETVADAVGAAGAQVQVIAGVSGP